MTAQTLPYRVPTPANDRVDGGEVRIVANDVRRCAERHGRHDFVMSAEDPSIDECSRCKARRY